MNKDGIYYKVTEEYSELKRKKRELTKERNIINAKLEIIEDMLIDLDSILCKHGNHIYEHFREGESQLQPQESEASNE